MANAYRLLSEAINAQDAELSSASTSRPESTRKSLLAGIITLGQEMLDHRHQVAVLYASGDLHRATNITPPVQPSSTTRNESITITPPPTPPSDSTILAQRADALGIEEWIHTDWTYFQADQEPFVTRFESEVPVSLTVVDLYKPHGQYHVTVDGVFVGSTSEPARRDMVVSNSGHPGERSIMQGASWGQWKIVAGEHTFSICNAVTKPSSDYFEHGRGKYKISVCSE